MLTLSSDGILVTDLDHHPIACNTRFGKIFHVDPSSVPLMEIEQLRSYVYPRLQDPEAWARQLDQIYSDPLLVHEDEIELVDGQGSQWVKRSSIPLVDTQGETIGRVWSFADITEDKERARRQDFLYRVSTFHDPSPDKVCRFATEAVAECYNSVAVLSILDGNKVRYRHVANAPNWPVGLTENDVSDTYCQVAMRNVRTLLVQNALEHPEYLEISPCRIGLTRYLGAPIVNMQGASIGSICFLDSKSDQQLTEEDRSFMTLIAQRISAELERERLFELRQHEQKVTIERQAAELMQTDHVFSAINSAIGLLNRPQTREQLQDSQLKLLRGLLGFETTAMFTWDGSEWTARITRAGRRTPTKVVMDTDQRVKLQKTLSDPMNEWTLITGDSYATNKLLNAKSTLLVRLAYKDESEYILAFGSKIPLKSLNEHQKTHLVAISDQVTLLLTIYALNAELQGKNAQLLSTQDRLIHTEKLSIVGALSASVAHDIRNIVSAIRLECTIPTTEPEEFRIKIRENLERFNILSHRLLVYAKPKILAKENLDLHTVIRRACDMLAAQMKMWKVELVLELNGVCKAYGDETRVEHLLVNLMLNALHAMNTKGGILIIRTTTTRIEICDTGRGMDAETLSRVFDPFFSTRADGFGLGMFSCKNIAAEHGWTLAAESEPGKGTKVMIEVCK